MATITWLHLSDIHLQPKDSYNTNAVIKALKKDIPAQMKENGLAPDFVVVTGDIAFSGQKQEYDWAKRFFDELLSLTRLTKDKLFVLPGNHDVDRTAISPLGKTASSLLKDRDAVTSFLSDRDDRALVFKRLHNYHDFVNSYFGELLPYDDDHYFYVKTIQIAEQQIALLGLNSAWLAGTENDRARLLLGEKQVCDALAQASDSTLRIALMHHPFDWLQEFDRTDVESLLSENCHFVLHGHMHAVDLLRADTPDTETMVIAAGALYATRAYLNSYNLVQIDLSTFKGKIYLRSYIDRQGGFWTRDVVSYKSVPNGVFEFRVPKQSLIVKMLASKLGDESIASKLFDDLAQLGSEAVKRLVAQLDADFAKNRTAPSALELKTLRQQRAFWILQRMAEPEAAEYLRPLGPEDMILIPAGTFRMGSDRYPFEGPVRDIWLNSFYLARYLVTNSEFHSFIQEGGYRDARYWTKTGWAWAQAQHREYPHRWADNVWQDTPDHPVQWLTWYEAMAYARWMALQTGAPYRLPTEAEWEKAASWDAGNRSKREYPWGDVFDWSFCNLRGQWTVPVGSCTPRGDTPDGLADMAGQVWQWTSSRRLAYPYKPDDGREDPAADGERAMRGGCWANQSPEDARCVGRYPLPVWPTMNTDGSYDGPCGLRLALGFTGREL